MRMKQQGRPIPLVMVELPTEEDNKKIREVQHVARLCVIVEDLRRKSGIGQWHPCQGFRHAQRYCSASEITTPVNARNPVQTEVSVLTVLGTTPLAAGAALGLHNGRRRKYHSDRRGKSRRRRLYSTLTGVSYARATAGKVEKAEVPRTAPAAVVTSPA